MGWQAQPPLDNAPHKPSRGQPSRRPAPPARSRRRQPPPERATSTAPGAATRTQGHGCGGAERAGGGEWKARAWRTKHAGGGERKARAWRAERAGTKNATHRSREQDERNREQPLIGTETETR